MDSLKNENGWPESKFAVRPVDDLAEDDVDEKLGTAHDQRAMIRMGKKQELRRNFRFFSIWGFAVMLGCSWEYVFMSVESQIGVAVGADSLVAATASCHYPTEALQEACGCSLSPVAACSSSCFVSAVALFFCGKTLIRFCKPWLKWPVSLPQRRR